MAITVQTLETLHQYICGVMDRADHHAPNVDEISLALIGAVVWKITDADVQVKEYAGSPANILWMDINDRRYVLAYNHNDETIELRDSTIKGDVIASFDNSTPISEIKDVFNEL